MNAFGLGLILVLMGAGCVTGKAAEPDASSDSTAGSDVVVVNPDCGYLDENWSDPQGWKFKGGEELGPSDSGEPLVLVAGDELRRAGFRTLPASGRLTVRMRVPDGGAPSSSQIQMGTAEGDWGLFLDTSEGSLEVDLRTMAGGFAKTESVLIPTPSEWFLLEVSYDGVDTTLTAIPNNSNPVGLKLKGFSPTPSTDIRLQAGFHMEVERLTLDLCPPSRTTACTPTSCGECAVCDPLVGCATAPIGTTCDGSPPCQLATCIDKTCTCLGP